MKRSLIAAVLCWLALGCAVAAPNGGITRAVTNGNDSGSGSLRDALINAGAGDLIVFEASVAQVNVTSGSLPIEDSLEIRGNSPQTKIVRVPGSPEFPLMTVTGPSTVTLNRLDLRGGESSGVTDAATAVLANNLGSGSLQIFNSIIADNGANAGSSASAIFVGNGTLQMERTQVRNNLSKTRGAVQVRGQNLFIRSSLFFANRVGDTSGFRDIWYVNLDAGGTRVVSMENTTFRSDSNSGGSIWIEEAVNAVTNIFLTHSTFSREPNRSGMDFFTLGNSLGQSTLTVANCIFEGGEPTGNIARTSQGGNAFFGLRPAWAQPNDIEGLAFLDVPEQLFLRDLGGNVPVAIFQDNSLMIDTTSQCAGMTQDARGVTRPIDGNNDQIALCDPGAYEAGPKLLGNGFE
ncbi:choice-of-anchor Q domain-containing protein [Ahniella affigens]|uniref:choice-of-anchor Q domain-containing protein n=1 Tax=Ahniella affigens TaxID=2021234 RepID=UPI0011B216B6|nr:choice-of-anchor Q domain-containing protein [Ahniella affigens]